MRIWIDLANSPHVPFFRALIPDFIARGHQIEITARDFAQTVELAMKAGMTPHVIGGHGGGSITGKAGNLVGRAAALRKWARDRGFDLAVSHNSYAQIAATAALGIRSVTLMDYEHQPANHLAFRLASRVIVPHAFPSAELKKYGASTRKSPNTIIPREALDGSNLIAHADLVISAGGTMNREAAALGVPALSVYVGKWAAIDEELIREGRLKRIQSREEISGLSVEKKYGLNPPDRTSLPEQILELICQAY